MIRVAFLFTFSKEYKGGINYLKNLFYATKLNNYHDLEYYMFVSPDLDQEYIDLFAPFATIVKTDILKKGTSKWFVNKVFSKLLKKPLLLFSLFAKYRIDILSHSWFIQKNKSIKLLNWIPDFQNLHYPNLWSDKEIELLNKFNDDLIKYSDAILLSSYDALNDLKQIAPDGVEKAKVLQFVSQPGELDEDAVLENTVIIKDKYGIGDRYFYLPNQFWAHKNHITVFKAIGILTKKGLNLTLVTTGVMNDARGNNDNIIKLKKFVTDNKLDKNILLLGVIPYAEVLTLMHNSLAVINPSLFEGWSSTVEEAKSMGKTIILSDIAVHQEQRPQNALYFGAQDEEQLALILENIWTNGTGNTTPSKEYLVNDLLSRTAQFGNNYYRILKELVNK